MTNYERIKAMSVEEMTAFLANENNCEFCKLEDGQNCGIECKIGVKQWLESEAKE